MSKTKLISLEGLDSAIVYQQSQYLVDWLCTDVGVMATVVGPDCTVLGARLRAMLEDKDRRYGLNPLTHHLLCDALMMDATAEVAKALSEGEWVICPQWRHSYLAKRLLWLKSLESGTPRRVAMEKLHGLLKAEVFQPEVAIFFEEDSNGISRVKQLQDEIRRGMDYATKHLGKKTVRVEPGHYKPEFLHGQIRNEVLRLYPDDRDLRRYVAKSAT